MLGLAPAPARTLWPVRDLAALRDSGPGSRWGEVKQIVLLHARNNILQYCGCRCRPTGWRWCCWCGSTATTRCPYPSRPGTGAPPASSSSLSSRVPTSTWLPPVKSMHSTFNPSCSFIHFVSFVFLCPESARRSGCRAWWWPGRGACAGCRIELETKVREDLTITEKVEGSYWGLFLVESAY